MMSRLSRAWPEKWTWLSPWLIVGTMCILILMLVVIAYGNFHREKDLMLRTLESEGHVLVRSMEAGTRAGMMGMGWGNRQLQMLMEETARQPDVLYVALVDCVGVIVAHSDPSRVGKTMPRSFPEAGRMRHGFTDEEPEAFEVIKAYEPLQGGGHRWSGKGNMRGGFCPAGGGDSRQKSYLVVGLDPSPFDKARFQDLQQSLLLFLVLLAAGAAGFVSLFWAESYRTARRSFLDMRAFAATIVSQMPVGFVSTDLRGRIERMNPTANAILKGVVKERGSIEDIPGFGPVARKLREGDSVVEREIVCGLEGNRSVPLLVNASIIKDGADARSGSVYLFSDTSEIKHLEEQLRRSERMAALGRLAAGVAHEIRNPLSSIKGFAIILAGRLAEDPKGRELAQVMAQEVDRINRVVTELLDFARPTELEKRSCSMREVLHRSLKLVEHDVSLQQVRLQTRVEPESLSVWVDPDRFIQVLLNLYLNALQAMEEGGDLDVQVKLEGEQVVVRVTDSGGGISAEDLPHVFDPYFTTRPGGVGLGLANVHKLVQGHGGEIEAWSEPGMGTTFVVRLPAADTHSHL